MPKYFLHSHTVISSGCAAKCSTARQSRVKTGIILISFILAKTDPSKYAKIVPDSDRHDRLGTKGSDRCFGNVVLIVRNTRKNASSKRLRPLIISLTGGFDIIVLRYQGNYSHNRFIFLADIQKILIFYSCCYSHVIVSINIFRFQTSSWTKQDILYEDVTLCLGKCDEQFPLFPDIWEAKPWIAKITMICGKQVVCSRQSKKVLLDVC